MNPPANWYPDPTGRHGQRYWDGEQWTEHVFTDGVQGVDPLDATDAEDQQDAGSEQSSGSEQDTTSDDGAVAAGEAAAVGDANNGAAPEASGLFADAGDGPAADEPVEDEAPAEGPDSDADQDQAWEPEDGTQASDQDDAAVAPEVDTEDVVGTLDEVNESDGTSAAAATVAPEPDPGPEDDAATDEGSDDDDAPQGDFSDAFMVTPETVSRLVSRQASTAPQPAEEAPEEDAPEQEAVASEDAPQPVTAAPPAEEAPQSEHDAEEESAANDTATAGAIDAPPPSIPQRQTSDGGLGITGDLVGGAFAERAEAGPVALQNSRLLRCSLDGGSGVIARQGTMVAYQGEVGFERQGAGGVTRALKRAATGEGLAMMRAEGTGDVFFADGAQHVFLLHLEGGPGLSVNGRNVLAFSADLQWDIERVKGATLLAGGLFNTSLTGTGWVALVSDGEPVVLRTDEAPTHVDVNALVAWSGGLSTRITSTVSAKSLVGLGSGEAFQMAFDGSGIVVVQPSEGMTGAATAG